MLAEVQNRNKMFKDLQQLLIQQIRQEYLKSAQYCQTNMLFFRYFSFENKLTILDLEPRILMFHLVPAVALRFTPRSHPLIEL
jgi:hypothetical protein